MRHLHIFAGGAMTLPVVKHVILAINYLAILYLVPNAQIHIHTTPAYAIQVVKVTDAVMHVFFAFVLQTGTMLVDTQAISNNEMQPVMKAPTANVSRLMITDALLATMVLLQVAQLSQTLELHVAAVQNVQMSQVKLIGLTNHTP